MHIVCLTHHHFSLINMHIKFQHCKISLKEFCIPLKLDSVICIHQMLTTGLVIPPGTNRPPAVASKT